LIIAFPVAYFENNQQLLWLLPIVGLSNVFDGFASTAYFTLTRNIDVKRNIIFDLIFQVINLLVMLIWAWISPSIWALAAGTVVSSFLKMIGSYFLIKGYSNKFAWQPDMVKEIMNFGRWLLLATAATFISVNADKLILPKQYHDSTEGLKVLGVYVIAVTFAMIPQDIVGVLSGKIMFPIISKFSDLPREELRRKILGKRWIILLAIGSIVVFLSCFGDLLISKLYDKRYFQATWILPILALGVWPNLLYQSGVEALLGVGKPQYQAICQFFKSIYMCIALPLGFYWFGLLGFVVAVAINDLGLYALVVYGLWKEKLSFSKQDLSCTLILLMTIAVILGIRYGLGFGFPVENLFVKS
jgi:O-antigen/teichoic acid export membrane protein